MNIINVAKNVFPQELLDAQFIECLKSKGYYKDYYKDKVINKENKDNGKELFLKCLVQKGYITQGKYNEIICEIKNVKHVKIDQGQKSLTKEKRITFKEENDTYEIGDEKFIDYESVHIEGIEYYFNEKSLKVAENINFTDTGIWNCDNQKIEFTKEDDKFIHIERVEAIGGVSKY